MNRTRLPWVVLFVCAGVLIINSCNKNNQENLSKQLTDQAAAKEQVRAIISKEGRTTTFPIGQKIEAYYADKNGKRLPKAMNGTMSETITSPCNMTNSPTATILSFALNSICGTGYTISWAYQISTNNNIVATNAASSASTVGHLEIDNGATNLYTDNHCTATIVDNGVDPSRSGYELFTVSFVSGTVSVVNTSLFNSTNTLKMSATCETDCNPDNQDIPVILTPYTYGAPLTQPCDRIDPTFVVTTPGPIQVFGADPIGCSQTGYVFPNLQEFEFSTFGGFWVGELASLNLTYYLPPSSPAPYTNLVNGTVRGHYGYVDPYGILELKVTLSSGSYTMLTRYRNITFNHPLSFYGTDWPIPAIGVNCCAGAWSPVTTRSVTY